METLLSLMVGLGLSAACGFRIFVPPLVLSVAALSGHMTLDPRFEWIGTYPALIAFSAATCVEIAAYYVPWLDNLLDSIATPAAVLAGAVMATSVAHDLSPFLSWTLAPIAGGSVAGLVQTATVLARGTSTAATGGLANPLLATAELGGAVATSILALLMPVLVVLVVAAVLVLLIRRRRRVRA